MSEFAAGIALHGLGLAIASVMVWSAALVAGRCARNSSVGAAEATAVTTTRSTSAASSTVRAIASKMSDLVAGIAAAARRTVQAQCWAVGLNMTEALAVIALLRLSCSRVWAAVGLVARLLAVVAQPLRGRAHLSVMTNVAALVAGAT